MLYDGLKPGLVRDQVELGDVKLRDLIGGDTVRDEEELFSEGFEVDDKTFEELLRKEDEKITNDLEHKEHRDWVSQLSDIRRRTTKSLFTKNPKPRPADPLFSQLVKEFPEPEFGLRGVYKFTGKYFIKQTSGVVDARSNITGKHYRAAVEAGLAASYLSPRTARNYAEEYAESLEGEYSNAHLFIRRLIKAAIWSGTGEAKSAREDAECLREGFPENPKHASIPGFRNYSTYSLLILHDEDTDDTFLFTEADIERIRRLWTGLSSLPVYLGSYGLGGGDFARIAELRADGILIRNHLLHLMSKTNQLNANILCLPMNL